MFRMCVRVYADGSEVCDVDLHKLLYVFFL